MIHWNGFENADLTDFIQRLSRMKRHEIFTDSTYHVQAIGEDVLVATHEKDGKKAVGVFPIKGQTAFVPVDLPDGIYANLLNVFPIKGQTAFVPVDLPDGIYANLLNGRAVEVFRGGVQCYREPVVLIHNS